MSGDRGSATFVAAMFVAAAIDRTSSEPTFRQIARLVHDAVVTGRLASGAYLPPERDLARQLGVSRATVARALTELADSGLLERRVGRGTVVAFDAESWRAGPTAGIPWGALLTAIAPTRAQSSHAPVASPIAADAAARAIPSRGADCVIPIGSVADGTRFLVDALIRSGDRVVIEAPASLALTVALAMRGAVTLEVGSSTAFASELEHLLEGKPGAKLVWLRRGGALRGRGEQAHIAGLTKRLGLPVIEERPSARGGAGLPGVEPHDHVVRLDDRSINAPVELARLLRPLATALGVGASLHG